MNLKIKVKNSNNGNLEVYGATHLLTRRGYELRITDSVQTLQHVFACRNTKKAVFLALF